MFKINGEGEKDPRKTRNSNPPTPPHPPKTGGPFQQYIKVGARLQRLYVVLVHVGVAQVVHLGKTDMEDVSGQIWF